MASDPPDPRPRGRPKDPRIRLRILQAARQHFVDLGVLGASMDGIARTAGVSNRTIYSHFPGKDQLLWAVLEHEGRKLHPNFPTVLPDTPEAFDAYLFTYGVELLAFLSNPGVLEMGRLVLAESARHHDLARQFYAFGPDRSHTTIAECVAIGHQRQWVLAPDAWRAADHLLTLWQGSWLLKQQLGLQPPPTPSQIRTEVRSGLDVFLRAYRPPV